MGAILVAGGAGYIGSHTAKALGEAGRRAVLFDDLSAGHAEAALGATLVQGDVRDTATLRAVFREYDVTAVMQFAALLSVADSVADPVGYYHNNVVGSLSVLEAMVAESVVHFVFSSTAAVYGNPTETPMTEDHPTRPVNTYGETKLAIERALPHYERAYGMRSVSLRYFNACGADPDGRLGEDHDPETHLIPRALDAVTGGEPLVVFGDDYETPDGTCLRDYVHVADLAAAHVQALAALESGGASAVYNLGTGRPQSVRDVMTVTERVSGRAVPHVVSGRRQGDPSVLFASSQKIQRELCWKPRYTELSGIVETAWRWHQRRR